MAQVRVAIEQDPETALLQTHVHGCRLPPEGARFAA
jgi:hypothetical protein